MDRAATSSDAPPSRRHLAVVAAVLGAVVLASMWPLAWARSNGGVDALLGAGADSTARPLIDREVPGAVRFASLGHDGQQFYVVARHPFDPAAAAPLLDSPTYRVRRIAFPALAGALAPHGGPRLVWAMLAVSLGGVALGAWAVSRFPDAPPWLPLVVGVTPGVGVALALSLGDALATGFALAAVAAALRHRWAWMTVALVAGALTRETLLLVAVGLVFTAAMPWRWRAAALAVPALAIGAWVAWSTQQIGASSMQGAAQFSLPLLGWIRSTSRPWGLALGLGLLVLLVVGARHTWRTDRGVSVVLGLHAALMACLATDVTVSWLNTTRVAAPVTALAVWAVVARGAPAEEPASVGSPAMQTSGPTPQLAGAR
ncbi:MAG: hypothetical protein KF703_07035 [Actinobacteria bacterium]|nr:hypothetical protein [Actinomycetota bacterium]